MSAASENNKVSIVSDLRDRSSEIEYQDRFYDSLAGIMHFTSECSAIASVGGRMVLSYNKSVIRQAGELGRDTYRYEMGLLDKLKSSITSDPRNTPELMGLYLLSNKMFGQELKNIIKASHRDDPCHIKAIRLKDYLVHCNQDFKASFISEKVDFAPIADAVYDLYCKLLKSLPDSTLGQEEKKRLLRPLQDCLKVHNFLKDKPEIRDQIIHMHLLENPNGLHAEHHLFNNIPKDKQEDTYIGIAKLSCGFCHDVLGPKASNHRGTHGIVDPQWKPRDKREEIASRLKMIEGEPITQHRRLSFDMHESSIILPKEFSGRTLAQFKEACRLISHELVQPTQLESARKEKPQPSRESVAKVDSSCGSSHGVDQAPDLQATKKGSSSPKRGLLL